MGTHIKLWLAFLLLVVLGGPFITTTESVRESIGREYGYMKSSLGDEAAREIIQSTNNIYQRVFLTSDIVPTLQKHSSEEARREVIGETLGRPVQGFAGTMSDYLLTVSTQCYLLIARMVMLWKWLPFVVPFVIAAMIDGWTQHRVKTMSVRVSNPIAGKLASHLMVITIMVPILYAIIPFAVSPSLMLIWLAWAAFPIMLSASEMSPISYK